MAQKRSNGGNGGDPNLRALRDVVVELRRFREDSSARLEALSTRMEQGFTKVDERLDEGFGKMNARLERVEERLDGERLD